MDRQTSSNKAGGPKSREASLPKRFYKDVSVQDAEDGFAVALDGRIIKTPGRATLLLPHNQLADTVAEEWRAQKTRIDPATMPLTQLANTAIDRVAGSMDEVRADIRSFAGTDLLCYRAENPESLVKRQNATWDPVLAWAKATYGIELDLVAGIMPVDQPEKSLTSVFEATRDLPPLGLAAAHLVTTLTGSALLALALIRGHLSGAQVWAAAHVDEDWQIEHWGEDAEARARRSARKTEFDAAALAVQHTGSSVS